MESKYYLDYYKAEREHWFFRARNAVIMAHISDLVGNRTDLKILNIGIATGHTSELLEQYGTVKSVEYDDECYQFVKSKLPQLDLVQGSILELDFDQDSYDLVCAFDVIEHIEDDQTGVNEMKRVCNTDGHIVVTVPAFMSLWSHHDVINHHFKRYRKNEVRTLINDDDQLQYLGYFNFFLFIPVWFFRKLNNILGFSKNKSDEEDTAGSDLDYFSGGGFLSKLFYYLLASEIPLVKKRIVLPFGVSVLASWKKT
jgi:SAM-dependent methyltransferase